MLCNRWCLSKVLNLIFQVCSNPNVIMTDIHFNRWITLDLMKHFDLKLILYQTVKRDEPIIKIQFSYFTFECILIISIITLNLHLTASQWCFSALLWKIWCFSSFKNTKVLLISFSGIW